MDLKEEKKLLKMAQEDENTFSQIYEEHYAKIFNYILRRVFVLEIAQDVTSEVFFKAFKNLWQFQWRHISFSAWLYKIATHEISNYFRKNPNQNLSLDRLIEEKKFEPSIETTPKTELMAAQEKLKQHRDFLEIQTKIAQLPFHYQTVITLRFFEKKKIKEIAEILGKKEGTVKSLLSRGLEHLRNLIEMQPSLATNVIKNSNKEK